MDRITLRGIRAQGRHGAHAHEREQAQPFVIDVAVEVDLHEAAESDDLSRTLDYAALHERLVGVVETTSYSLLERLADNLLWVVFEDARVARAEVTIAKPAILGGATPSVTLTRMNRRHGRRP
jgi:7,8-dihydroneopterin aldolase/epimerase/oxygenase